MKKKERLEALIAHYSDGKPTRFAKHIGVAPSTISTWIARDTFDYDLLFAKCEMISPEWLLTGKGPMLKPTIQEPQVTTQPSTPTAKDRLPEAFRCLDPLHATQELIPLVTPKVAAGFGSADFVIAKSDVKEYYVIPKWKRQRVDFMIEVTGDSMQPKYNAGDIVGCTIIHNSGFIQWNRPHVIATHQTTNARYYSKLALCSKREHPISSFRYTQGRNNWYRTRYRARKSRVRKTNYIIIN